MSSSRISSRSSTAPSLTTTQARAGGRPDFRSAPGLRAGAPQPDHGTGLEEAARRETERTHDDAIAAGERALFAEVERALAKIDDGGYGVSERTGAPIPHARPAAMAWAREAIKE